MTTQKKEETGLALLRQRFPAHQISKLPKPTKWQTDEVRADASKGIRCKKCDGWHHPKVVHLDYVGHAALTDRLLDCDPHWNWEPMALTENGTPLFDGCGGLWIRLTVCGETRLGYGHADGKQGGDAIKEAIGDALRNAAMRFGAALDLWHKGDLHGGEDEPQQDGQEPPFDAAGAADRIIATLAKAETIAVLDEINRAEMATVEEIKATSPDDAKRLILAYRDRKAALQPKEKAA